MENTDSLPNSKNPQDQSQRKEKSTWSSTDSLASAELATSRRQAGGLKRKANPMFHHFIFQGVSQCQLFYFKSFFNEPVLHILFGFDNFIQMLVKNAIVQENPTKKISFLNNNILDIFIYCLMVGIGTSKFLKII